MLNTRVYHSGRKIEGKKVKEKVLVTWNKKYAQREQARREGALDYARKLTQPQLYRMTSKKGGKKYLEVRLVDPKTGEILPYKPTITLDEDRINFDAQFDGINVIVTSELTMSDEEIISAYGELIRNKTGICKNSRAYTRTFSNMFFSVNTC